MGPGANKSTRGNGSFSQHSNVPLMRNCFAGDAVIPHRQGGILIRNESIHLIRESFFLKKDYSSNALRTEIEGVLKKIIQTTNVCFLVLD